MFLRRILSIFILFLAGCQSNWAPVNDINPQTPKLSVEPIVQPPEPPPFVETEPTFVETAPKPAPISQSAWQWPVKGVIIGHFKHTKGIDIAGAEGEIIHAARDGEVVYSGSGLRGYGQLLIIKHNEQYLSAYAHNRKLLVKEGDFVKIGQPIAEMGNTDTNRVKLHFEIRNNGSPVDPLRYLPK